MRRGFVLLIVIMILIFMGTVLFVLTEVSNKITFQTNRVFLETVEQNMISSGIAWTKYNIENGNKNIVKEIQLDTAGIGTRNSQLTVTVEEIARKQTEIAVNTSCGFGSQSFKHNKKYIVLKRQ